MKRNLFAIFSASALAALTISLALLPSAHAQDKAVELAKSGSLVQFDQYLQWGDSRYFETGAQMRVLEIYNDGSASVERLDGSRKFHVDADVFRGAVKDLGCAEASGTKICTGDRVSYFPDGATIGGFPTSRVEAVFPNGKVIYKAGNQWRQGDLDAYREWSVGKELQCMEKPIHVCKGDKVYQPSTGAEGKVDSLYSNGVVEIHTSFFWRALAPADSILKAVTGHESVSTDASKTLREPASGVSVASEVAAASAAK